jgi:hypothetical protein
MLNFFDSNEYSQGLKLSTSGNDLAIEGRKKVYFDAMENLDLLRQLNAKMRNFDASGELNAVENLAPSAMGVALAEATMKAQINSIVGYVAIERSMTQMSQMMVYRDIITKAGASVMPLIGPDDPRTRANKTYNAALTAGTTYSVTLDKMVAGSLAITLVIDGHTYPAMDDRKGNILAKGGLLADGSQINYETGKLDLVFADAVAATDTIKICYALNKEAAQGNDRTTLKQGYFNINAHINKFEFEADLITAMISQKTVGGDVIAELQQSVQDEQILSINNQLVDTLRANYAGTTMSIDLSAFSIEGGFFDSLLKVLNAGLQAVDNAMAARCYKVVAATSYIVGNGAATLFQSLEDAQGWVANASGYVNDVIGFYKGRAVIRHLHCDDFECYAIHKTPNGQLAPLGYGILLPATNLPLVGNFANTNEIASGIYSVDGTNTVAMPLVQKFTITMPADWMVLAQ